MTQGPPGRQPLNTYLAEGENRTKWWEFFRNHLKTGRQGYVIVPLVEESEHIDTANLEATFEELASDELEAFRLGLVHGRMSAEEKDQALNDFAAGRTQVLVATSVVEVGIDVPNATLMTILGANRFGLAQLHQMRGRVTRGKFPGYCCVFADETSEEANARLTAFVATTDGFKLAETDFDLRGPGDLLGTRQHGLPPFHLADLKRDAAIVSEARADARKLVADDPGLAKPEHGKLRKLVLAKYGLALDLGDVA
jgi:ATP-dependent DNA helicase RecG